MSLITSAELRRRFAAAGYSIRIRTVSFVDLARCSGTRVDIVLNGEVRPSITFDEESRKRWEPANRVIGEVKHMKMVVRNGPPQTITFS